MKRQRQEARDAAVAERRDQVTRGGPTEKIWYYDLSIVERAAIEAKNFDLKAVNPNAKSEEDTRTPEEILDLIEQKQIAEAIGRLRAIS